MAKKLYVGNLSFNTTQAQIRDLFAEAGEIIEVNFITDKFTGQAKGFAFVEMGNDDQAQQAITRFNGYSLDGRPLTVNEARPRNDSYNNNRGGRRF